MKKFVIFISIISYTLFIIFVTTNACHEYYNEKINNIIIDKCELDPNTKINSEELYKMLEIDKAWNEYKNYIINK